MEGNENKNQTQEPKEDKEVLGTPSEAEIESDPETKVEIEPTPELTPEPEPEPDPKPISELETNPISEPIITSEPEDQETILPKTKRPLPPEMPIEEKKDLLSRAEIKTMAKDVSELRETEAEREKERIANLKINQSIPKSIEELQPSPVPKINEKEEEKLGKLIPKSLKRPSVFQKIAIRIVAVLFLILTIAFFYWFLNIKLNQKTEITPVEQETENVEESKEAMDTGTSSIEETTIHTEEETIEPIEIIKPETLNNIVTWGFYIPKSPRLIDTIIIHSIYNALSGDIHSVEKVIEEFKLYKVTSHYLIDTDGIIYQLAPDEAIAYHAGRGEMPDGSRKNIINNFSLGIEMLYSNTETPNKIQLEKLVELTSYLRKEYNIPTENILGHKDVSLGGKDDPWNFEKNDLINLLK
ncbi:MAG: peptidoglycan recognition family protein [Candidatus Nealsonbacteria bacterium]